MQHHWNGKHLYEFQILVAWDSGLLYYTTNIYGDKFNIVK